VQEYTSKSMIDLFSTVDKNMFRNEGAIPFLPMDSTRRMVTATLKWSKENPKRISWKPRLNVEKLKAANYAQNMKTKISSRLGESQADDLQREWKKYKHALTSAVEESLGAKKAYTRRKKTTLSLSDE